MMLRETGNQLEICPNEETAWVLPDKKFIIQSKTLRGIVLLIAAVFETVLNGW